MPVFKVLRKLNLSDDQRTQVKEIMMNSKKRENMIKLKADMIEIVYAVLNVNKKNNLKFWLIFNLKKWIIDLN